MVMHLLDRQIFLPIYVWAVSQRLPDETANKYITELGAEMEAEAELLD